MDSYVWCTIEHATNLLFYQTDFLSGPNDKKRERRYNSLNKCFVSIRIPDLFHHPFAWDVSFQYIHATKSRNTFFESYSVQVYLERLFLSDSIFILISAKFL